MLRQKLINFFKDQLDGAVGEAVKFCLEMLVGLAGISLIVIGVSKKYKIDDFFIVLGFATLCVIALVAALGILVGIWATGKHFIKSERKALNVLGYFMTGTTILTLIVSVFWGIEQMPYTPYDDCGYIPSRYC